MSEEEWYLTPPEQAEEWSTTPPEQESKQLSNKPDISGIASKSAISGMTSISKSGQMSMFYPTDPIGNIAERVIQSAYQEAKRPILDASPFQGSVSRTAQSIGIDILASSLAGSGVATKKLSNTFIKSKPMASDKEIVKEIVKVSNKLYDKTANLLRPSDLAEFIGKETKHPAVVEMSGIIKKSKNAEAAISKVNKTIDEIFGERSKLLAENNKPIQPKYLTELSKFIDDKVSNGTATEAQVKGMRAVLTEESNKIDWTKFDLLAAEQKKEFYQGMAKRVYKADGMDELTSGAQQAYTILASGAKKLVESVVPKVKAINQRYDGLKDGRELLAKLQDKMIKNPNETLNAIAQTIGRPSKSSVIAAGVRQLPVVRHWGTYKQASKSIEKLNNESEALRAILRDRIKASARSGV